MRQMGRLVGSTVPTSSDWGASSPMLSLDFFLAL
jgi:hypothetical protein